MKKQWTLYPGPGGLLCPDSGKAFESSAGAMYVSGAKLERMHMLEAADAAFRYAARSGLKAGETFLKLVSETAGPLSVVAKSTQGRAIAKEVRAHVLWSLSGSVGIEPDVSGVASAAALGFLEWTKETKFKAKTVNYRAFDERIGYSSEIFAIGDLEGVATALSVVIGSAIYDDDMQENAGAVHAANAGGHGVEQGAVVRLPRDADDLKAGFECRIQREEELQTNFEIFNLKMAAAKLANEWARTYAAKTKKRAVA